MKFTAALPENLFQKGVFQDQVLLFHAFLGQKGIHQRFRIFGQNKFLCGEIICYIA